MTQDDSGPKLKVTDRRMFTADGELRTPEESNQSPPAPDTEPEARFEAEVRTPAAEPPQTTTSGDEPAVDDGSSTAAGATFQGKLPEPGFADLLSMLAEPIALFLGDVPLPDGKSAENLELARFHIDLLGVLKQKTESNLSQEESAVLEDLLYRLRMRYVQKSQ